MNHAHLVALTTLVSFTALLGACTTDEPATYIPRDGTWILSEHQVESNTCDAQFELPAFTEALVIDSNSDDEFEIELGAAGEINCEIDGTDFVCGAWEVVSTPLVDFDVDLTLTIRWEGEFISETEMTGTELTTLGCVGDSCATAPLVNLLPCSRDLDFAASVEG